jgi:DNA-binding transcriptional MerR regulator
MNDQLRTTGQVLELLRYDGLHVSPATLEFWIRSGRLPKPEKIGHLRMWTNIDVSRLRSLLKERDKKW